MKIFFSFLLSPFFIFAEDFDWGDKIVSIKNVSNFASELKILSKENNQILYESLLGLNQIIKIKRKKIDSKSIFFLHSGISGEGFSAENLHYIYFKDSHIQLGTIENVKSFKFQNLNQKSSKNLILLNFKNLRAEDYICKNQKNKINLTPIIYEFQGERFQLVSEKSYLKNYLKLLETKLDKKITKRTFSNLLLYAFLSRKLSVKVKSYDININYSCSETVSVAKNKKITFTQFIKKYSNQIF